MSSIVNYIKTGSTAVSGGTTVVCFPGMWCRPQHKPTCCMGISGGNSCCICIPASATCYVIEMWSQGGGGGGGCCCGNGPIGGQGGSYTNWVCSKTAAAITMCGCACWCQCSSCSICSGPIGQYTRMWDCTNGICWCLCGGTGGLWCCFFGNSCYNQASCQGLCASNTWLFMRNCSQYLAGCSSGSTATNTGACLPFCTVTGGGCFTPGTGTYSQSATYQTGICPASPWDCIFVKNECNCFMNPTNPGYVWYGSFGYSDPNPSASPWQCQVQNAYTTCGGTSPCTGGPFGKISENCGSMMGVGGAAYAGGDQAWMNCTNNVCYSCWVQHGNFPGGGGKTSAGFTAWTQPGAGAPGLILISYC